MNLEYPEYQVKDGKISRGKRTKYIPEVRLKKIKSERYKPSEEEDSRIIDELKSRVILNGKTLAEHIPKFVPKVINKVKESSTFTKLKEKYDALKTDYRTLLGKNEELEQDKRYLQLQCGKRSYSEQLKDLYTNKHAQSEAKLVSRILSGEYRGNIDALSQGDFSENDENIQLWSWEDRMKPLEHIDFGRIDEIETRRIKDIIKDNSYLREKHPESYQRLTELLR